MSAECMTRYLAAWGNPDPQDLIDLCAPDVKMHVGGDHGRSGTYLGHEGTMELHRRMLAATDANFAYRLEDVLADDDHAVAVTTLSLQQGNRELNATTVGAVRINADGLVSEAWYLTSDRQAENRFLREA
jgi:ketosteroid isomerase-like protein